MENDNQRTDKSYQGRERRVCPNAGACLDHSGVIQQVKTHENKIHDLEQKNFVPFSNYKWGIAILASVLVSLFSTAIYLALDTNKSLQTISSKQETTIYKISDMQKDVEELKRNSSEELKEIKKKLHQHSQQP